MKLPRLLISFNDWFEKRPEAQRLFAYMVSMAIALLGLCIGVAVKSHALMVLGVIASVPASLPALVQAYLLGYKNTVSVITIAMIAIAISFLILAIF